MSATVLLLLARVFIGVHVQFSLASEGYSKPSNVIRDTAEDRIRGFEDRSASQHDFVLGGLFAVHADTDGCRGRLSSHGVEHVEAMMFAIDHINSDTELLPNISLGYDIRDTCHIYNVGLRETLDLITRGSRLDYQGETGRLPTVGIVGPATSLVSIPSAGLGQLFEMPQVSYASSSPDLSDKERYGYFLRTIPPDTFQAQAIVDLLLHFNWTLVSIIYSSNSYGIHGRDEIISLTTENAICVDVDQGIGRDWTETEFEELATQLVESSSNIVIGFMSEPDAEPLLSKVSKLESYRQLTWIASDTWSDSAELIRKYGSYLTGTFGIIPFKRHIEEFQAYVFNITIRNNVRDVWFPHYFASLADCDVTHGGCDNETSIPQLENYIYEQNSINTLVIDAVYAFAHSLHQYLMENCDPPLQWNRTSGECKGHSLRELNGSVLLKYIKNVNFTSLSGNSVYFDDNGDVDGLYNVVNIQAESNFRSREYRAEVIGAWNGKVATHLTEKRGLTIMEAGIQFGLDSSNEVLFQPRVSQCAHCSIGYIRQLVPSSCCGTCVPCLEQNYSLDPTSFTCQTCDEGTWGNQPHMGSDACLQIEEIYLDFSNPWSICIMLLSSLGLIAVGVTLAIFCMYLNTAVVKSSGREQMMLLLVGIAVCFCTAVVYVAPPSLGTCIVQRFGLWICYSLMFGAILVKIIRVARIFFSKPTISNHGRFSGPRYMILYTLLIVAGGIVISVISVLYRYPMVDRYFQQRHDENPVYILTCTTDPIPFLVILVAYVSTIIFAATILGIISYKFPKNFNEAKHITFCTLSLLIIWIGFIPSYVATVSLHIIIQNCIIAIALVVNAFSVLFCLYGPKIRVILFRPAKNSHRFSTHHPPAEISMGTIGDNILTADKATECN